MNGSGGLGIRRFCRLAGCVAALAALSAMTLPSVAAAKPPKVRYTYLSLGDSLAFGYSTQAFNENLTNGDQASHFENGYTNDYFAKVNAGGKVALVNDGCPGETTESLIGNNPALLAGLNAALKGKIPEPVTGEAPCAYQTAGLPLHHPYPGKSQLESALETLAVAAAEHKPVKGITLDIGSNDTLHVVAKVEKEVEARQKTKVEEKAKIEAEFEIDEKVEHNAEEEVGVFLYIKAGETCEADDPGHGAELCASEYDASGHTYREVFEGQYKATHEAEVVGLFLHEEENYVQEKATDTCEADFGPSWEAVCASEYDASGHTYYEVFEGQIVGELTAEGKAKGEADGAKYLAEHGAELVKEGHELATKAIEAAAPALFEQINVNEVGILSAIRNTGFKGKIIFVGAYDPYGRVKYLSVGHAELAPGFNALLAALNSSTQTTLHKHPLKACFVNNENLFNPASVSNTVPNEELEENQLFAWTNMANGNVTNVPDVATLTESSAEITGIKYPFLAKGDKVSATNLPAGTTVVSVSGSTAILSKAATGSGTELITIGKSDGGDIHATKEGYEKMAGNIDKSCAF